MSDDLKKKAAVHKTNGHGKSVLVGYNAVDPSGNLVQLAPSTGALPGPGWSWATADDLKKAKDAELARKTDEPKSDGGPLKK